MKRKQATPATVRHYTSPRTGHVVDDMTMPDGRYYTRVYVGSKPTEWSRVRVTVPAGRF